MMLPQGAPAYKKSGTGIWTRGNRVMRSQSTRQGVGDGAANLYD
jgi:hypothetical protein